MQSMVLRWLVLFLFFFFSSRRRHTRFDCDWSSDVCSSDLGRAEMRARAIPLLALGLSAAGARGVAGQGELASARPVDRIVARSEEHTSELQSQSNLVCRLLLEKKKNQSQSTRCYVPQCERA